MINNKYPLVEKQVEVKVEPVETKHKIVLTEEEVDVDALMAGYEEPTNKINQTELLEKLKSLKR
ncbi:MAG: hypothetical protein J6S85_26145 [Methanobrevibacter sp.]|nr:hypothetical protein [Methanobrevibacter sp.]MBO7717074.1 hypothetical protein [Methanobrevibacter sp.]